MQDASYELFTQVFGSGYSNCFEIVNLDELSKTNPLNLHTISPVCSVCIDRGYESTSFKDTDCIRRNPGRGAKWEHKLSCGDEAKAETKQFNKVSA